jgi:hypothetical protein
MYGDPMGSKVRAHPFATVHSQRSKCFVLCASSPENVEFVRVFFVEFHFHFKFAEHVAFTPIISETEFT